MSLRKYLTSRVFFIQLFSAVAIVGILGCLFFHWITFVTHHGDEITVPNLSKLTPEQAEEKLDELNLSYEVIDTVDFMPDYPRLTVVKQEPQPGEKVKGGRTIYLKINAATFKLVAVPDLIDKSYRQALPTLKAIGLREGEKRYVPSISKDMVLEMWFNGKKIKAGEKVLKASKIDLVLGDGKIVLKEKDIDSLVNGNQDIKETPKQDTIPTKDE